MTPLIREVFSWLVAAPTDANDPTELHWFDISAVKHLGSIAVVDMLKDYRPPFEKNFVVWRGEAGGRPGFQIMMAVTGVNPTDGIAVNVWEGWAGQRPKSLPGLVYRIVDGAIVCGPVFDDEPLDNATAEAILPLVSAWYKAIDNHAEAYAPAVEDTFTNRRKIAAGKAPTYEWRTVTIQPSQVRPAKPTGGTHASPRLHDRRGHLRRMRSGKSVWVKPCKVGRAELGAVFHDYKVAA